LTVVPAREYGRLKDGPMFEGSTPLGRLRALPLVLALVFVALPPAPARANLPSEIDGLIAYQHGDDADGQIWVLDPAAASPEAGATKLSDGSAPEASPAWGPYFQGAVDLAFQRRDNGNWDIWGRTPWSSPEAPLVVAPGNQTEPVYSDAVVPVPPPAGVKGLLAYISDQTGSREVWVRDRTGATTQLTTDGLGYANPEFSGAFQHHGGHIDLAFESTRAGVHGIWTMDLTVNTLDGALLAHAAPRLVVAGPDEPSQPSWQTTQPDLPPLGRVVDVVFATQESGNSYLDYVEEPYASALPFSGGDVPSRYELTGDPGGDSDPVWAPFGDRIVFTRTIDGNSDIWVMAANGTNLRRLTSSPGPDVAPSWQPGEESSADIVGGHTAPGPATRTPKPSGGGDNGGNNGGNDGGNHGNGGSQRRSPGLGLDHVRWHGGHVRVAGHAVHDFGGQVKVKFRCGTGARRTRTRRVATSKGHFHKPMTVPRACRRRHRATVTARYPGNGHYLPQTVTVGVRRR
jgi:Tol biopolymer transport system component